MEMRHPLGPQLALLLSALAAISTPLNAQKPDRPEPAAPEASGGLWPSDRMIELLIARWSEALSDRYRLNDAQRAKVRQTLTKRGRDFLNEHRSTIQPLVNAFIEMRLELQPPSRERLGAWSRRAVPVVERLREQIEQGRSELRVILSPEQRPAFEVDASALLTGVHVAEEKLKRFERGDFDNNDLQDFWEPTRRWRAEHGDNREAVARHGGLEPEITDQIALELGAWEDYVRAFISTYRLDEGQRDAVLSCLAELKERALAHRDRHREDINRLERRIETFTGSEEELTDLKKRLTELYGPIDAMFAELKSRIERIPTGAQRGAAVESHPKRAKNGAD